MWAFVVHCQSKAIIKLKFPIKFTTILAEKDSRMQMRFLRLPGSVGAFEAYLASISPDIRLGFGAFGEWSKRLTLFSFNWLKSLLRYQRITKRG